MPKKRIYFTLLEMESILKHSLRAFFVSIFAVLGVFIALTLLMIALIASYKSLSNEEEGFSSKVKILPDAKGARKELSSDTPVILQINIEGEIGKEELTGEKIGNQLLDSREDDFEKDRVKAIFLVINSPGGDVNDSDIIYRHLKEYKKRYKVPIYAYVNGMCASGGYYIACSSDKILASEVSLVGSIGVLAWPPFFNVHDTLEKLGVNTLTLLAGQGKDELNPTRPWKEGEQKDYQELIDFYYQKFVSLVSLDRPQIKKEKLVNEYGAKVFPVNKALEYGYIDDIVLSRNEALAQLAQTANLETYQVIEFTTKTWWRKLIKEQSPLLTGKMKHEFNFSKKPFPFSFIYRPHFQ